MADNLLTRQRQGWLAERLARDGRVVANEIARELGVSDDTVRRDLREMAAAGLCERVYGGALPLAPQTGTLAERRVQMADAKERLAAAAVPLIGEGATIFVDAGSTNAAVAAALGSMRRLTLLTNAPAVALAVPSAPGIETLLVGGRYDPALGACLGSRALREAGEFRADLMILGACGVDAEAGVTAFSQDEAELKRRVAEGARAVMVVATADKLRTAAPFRVLAPGRLTHLVTQASGDPATLRAFEAAGTTVHRIADA